MKVFRCLIRTIALSCAVVFMAAHGAAEPIRPNVVVIVADDMGYADIGVHGCRDIPTPNIDQIASRGVHHYLSRASASPAGQRGAYTSPIRRNREPVEENRYLTTAFGEEAAAFIDRRQPMNDAVGAVLRALEKTGALETTLVIFTNDNGGPTTRNAVNGSSNSPLRGSKCETFEGGIRVPLLMQWPSVLPAGETYEQPVMTCDITATVLAVAGGDLAGGDGVDLIPFVTGRNQGPPHEALFWRCRMRSNNYAARLGRWKFVHSTEGDAAPGPKQTPARDMLFDLAAAIGERNNLAAEHPEKLAELKAR